MFKNWNWKQWTGIGIFAAYIIATIVLTFTSPVVMYWGLVSIAVGVIGTLFIKARKTERK